MANRRQQRPPRHYWRDPCSSSDSLVTRSKHWLVRWTSDETTRTRSADWWRTISLMRKTSEPTRRATYFPMTRNCAIVSGLWLVGSETRPAREERRWCGFPCQSTSFNMTCAQADSMTTRHDTSLSLCALKRGSRCPRFVYSDADFFSVNSCSKRHISIRITRRRRKVKECASERMKMKRVDDVWTSFIQSGASFSPMNRVTLTDGMWLEWKIGVNGIRLCTHTISLFCPRGK